MDFVAFNSWMESDHHNIGKEGSRRLSTRVLHAARLEESGYKSMQD